MLPCLHQNRFLFIFASNYGEESFEGSLQVRALQWHES